MARIDPLYFRLCLDITSGRGYNIGTRLIEDFLARTSLGRCSDFRETGEVVAKVGFKAFLNVVPSISHSSSSGSKPAAPAAVADGSAAGAATTAGGASEAREFTLTLDENPLTEFVEPPPEALEGGLWFSNVLAGVLRGALEMVSEGLCFSRILTLKGIACLRRSKCKWRPSSSLMCCGATTRPSSKFG